MPWIQIALLVLSAIPWIDLFKLILEMVLDQEKLIQANKLTGETAREEIVKELTRPSNLSLSSIDSQTGESHIRRLIEVAYLCMVHFGVDNVKEEVYNIIEYVDSLGEPVGSDSWYTGYNPMDWYASRPDRIWKLLEE